MKEKEKWDNIVCWALEKPDDSTVTVVELRQEIREIQGKQDKVARKKEHESIPKLSSRPDEERRMGFFRGALVENHRHEGHMQWHPAFVQHRKKR